MTINELWNSPPTWLVVVVALAYEATLIIAWLLDSSPLGLVRLPRITALPFVLVLGLTGHTTSCLVAVVVFGVGVVLEAALVGGLPEGSLAHLLPCKRRPKHARTHG